MFYKDKNTDFRRVGFFLFSRVFYFLFSIFNEFFFQVKSFFSKIMNIYFYSKEHISNFNTYGNIVLLFQNPEYEVKPREELGARSQGAQPIVYESRKSNAGRRQFFKLNDYITSFELYSLTNIIARLNILQGVLFKKFKHYIQANFNKVVNFIAIICLKNELSFIY